MKTPLPQMGADGFYHPTTQEQIVALVNQASQENLGIRCRGAAHSLARDSNSPTNSGN